MSLRAIKKRENQLNSSAGVRQPLFKKASTQHQQRKSSITSGSNSDNNSKVNTAIFKQPGGLHTLSNLQNQYTLLGRAIYSSPELRHPLTVDDDTVESLAHVVRTKSEGDLHALLKSCTGNAADTTGCGLIGAKSEVCLQSISSHSYQEESQTTQTSISNYTTESTISNLRTPVSEPIGSPQNTGKTFNRSMMSGARSHRDLTQSTYAGNSGTYDVTLSPTRRRMSECSLNSIAGYSQRTSAMSSSVLTLSSNNPAANEPNSVMRVPIIGYEVMEERARFTVYKLRVENPLTNDCWLVLRRYTDFVRLNTKLKQLFPNIVLLLPRKKIFGDNFNAVFLDNRVQGLQIFVNSIMAKEELRKCKLVREFFCLDEPPSYSESMEECRAIFEAQEETIAHLKVQVNSKNELILNLQQKLRDEIVEKEQLKLTLKNTSNTCPQCTATNSSAP